MVFLIVVERLFRLIFVSEIWKIVEGVFFVGLIYLEVFFFGENWFGLYFGKYFVVDEMGIFLFFYISFVDVFDMSCLDVEFVLVLSRVFMFFVEVFVELMMKIEKLIKEVIYLKGVKVFSLFSLFF